MHHHVLNGCTPRPLAAYLKALGILRLVGAQKDPSARGWWKNDRFHLVTQLDEEALLRFLADEYSPTPLIAPWNGGSGFYAKDNKAGISAIAGSRAERFTAYRTAIALATQVTEGRAESPKNEEKAALIASCRNNWRGPLAQWLDAAIVLDGDLSPSYPSLLGTGGNDGRLDFTNNYMQRVAELMDCSHELAPARDESRPLLHQAVFATRPAPGLSSKAVGQFLPGAAGGANGSTGFDADSLLNPWDFVFMLEGAVCFAASLSRRTEARSLPQASAPFAVRSRSVGFGHASGTEKATRGEQWLPLWESPALAQEVSALLSEGRVQLGRDATQNPVDQAMAISRLGVARGITAFERYAFLERNGQANLAIPLGRWEVRAQPHQDLLTNVRPWVERLSQKANGDQSPAAWGTSARRCEESLLACLRHPGDSWRWETLLKDLGAAEATLASSLRRAREAGLRPLPPLSPEWLSVLPRTDTVDLGLGVASIPGLRALLLPLAPGGREFVEAQGTSPGASKDPLRMMLSLQLRAAIQGGLPRGTAPVSLRQILAFILGDVAVDDIWSLALPLTALRWSDVEHRCADPRPDREVLGASASYGLLRLATTPQLRVLGVNYQVRVDIEIWRLLAAGSVTRASAIAVRRLAQAGLRPRLAHLVGDHAGRLARLLGAALLFPLRNSDLERIALRFAFPTITDSTPGAEEPASHSEQVPS